MAYLSPKFTLQKLKNTFWHLPKNIFFSFINGFPSKKLILIGVTGTDGKTTTATLIHHLLTQSGIKTGLISTIEAKIGDQSLDTGLHTTSPDPAKLQKFFRQMINQKVTHAVCEITSHALDQHRFWGCHFLVSLITNTSHEHLDYHPTMTDYIKTKALLFKQSSHAVLNKDDPSYHIIKKIIKTPIITYSINSPSQIQAKKIKLDSRHLQFKVGQLDFKTDSNFYYQIYNILATLGTLKILNVKPQLLQKVIKKYPETKGRREIFPNRYKFKTIIDYAHTPNGLEKTLSSLQKITKNKLIVIFGATGGRDQNKRPIMGQIVSKLADIAIITADDTRDEAIEDINRQIIDGIDQNKNHFNKLQKITSKKQVQEIRQTRPKKFTFFNIPNRQDAFNLAIKIAQTGDIVIACGKGHETTILHGKTDYPWSESEAFRTAFRLK